VKDVELSYATIEDLSKLLRAREASPVEVVDAALARVDSLDDRLHAFITVTADQARQEARKAEREIIRGSYRGPLHGVPVSVKDLIDVAGVRTTSGSKIRANIVAAENATAVARLRRAGAVLIGKTNLHEFAFGASGINPHYGTCRNPWNLDRIAVGSSSGSAVAVATGMGAASLGTDTGGSIRIPAALCGVVGLKPTYGRISRRGVFPVGFSIDHVGPLTRSVRDAAHVLDAIAGFDPLDSTSSRARWKPIALDLDSSVRRLAVGVLLPDREAVDAGVLGPFQRAVSDLTDVGLRVQEASIPEATLSVGIANAIIWSEMATVHHQWLVERPDDYGPDVREHLELASLIPATQYITAHQARAALIEAFRGVWAQFDVLVLPTVPQGAPPIDNWHDTFPSRLAQQTRLFNVLGTPVCTVPCGVTDEGVPVGLSIAGPAFSEKRVLDVALTYEQCHTWWRSHPDVAL
jgi:aspartyl-tRNA(Asn)/glutamyl-tRNA(Gln) amidotransferase subunit A